MGEGGGVRGKVEGEGSILPWTSILSGRRGGLETQIVTL